MNVVYEVIGVGVVVTLIVLGIRYLCEFLETKNQPPQPKGDTK